MSLIGLHISDLNEMDFRNFKFIQTFPKKYNQDIINTLIRHKIKITIHASYTINLSRKWKTSDWWILQLINEIELAHSLNAFAIVVHVGKMLDLSESEALNNMYSSLLYIHEETKKYTNVKILIETPSGQGSEILTDIDKFCNFMNKFYKHPDNNIRQRFFVCLDTCHVFASGHDIRTDKEINKFFAIIDNIIGIDKIKLCHLNDSKKGLNSRLDRHMSLGRGMIGMKSIKKIVKFIKSMSIPIILETPYENINDDLNFIKSL